MARKKVEFVPGTTVERNIFYEKNLTFTVRYTVVDDNGIIKHKKERGIKTITEARATLSKHEHNKKTGQSFETKKLTFAQLKKEYIEKYLKVQGRKNTIQNYSSALKKTKPIDHILIAKLKPIDIKNIYLNLRKGVGLKKPLEVSTINQLHITLSSLFSWAVAEEYIKPWNNPLKSISMKVMFGVDAKEVYFKVHTLSRKQVREIHEELVDTTYYYEICTALGTGMRVGELCGLKWGNIDLKQGIIHVVKGITYTKGKKGHERSLDEPKTKTSNRYIEIAPDLVKLLSKLKQERLKKGFRELEDEHVFLNNQKKPHIPMVLAAQCKKYILKLFPVFTEFTFHVFRHTFATSLFDAGAEIEEVARALGHASPETTRRIYIHQIKDRKRTIKHLLPNLYTENENNGENLIKN